LTDDILFILYELYANGLSVFGRDLYTPQQKGIGLDFETRYCMTYFLSTVCSVSHSESK
jgi:hypothetical protein